MYEPGSLDAALGPSRENGPETEETVVPGLILYAAKAAASVSGG